MNLTIVTKPLASGAIALCSLVAAWPASADPPPWARAHGWRGHHYRPHVYYYAPPPRPVYVAPPPVVMYHPQPIYYPAYPAYPAYAPYPPHGYYRSPPISNQDVGGLIGYGIGAVIGRSFDYRR
jgi:hypothetical protein